jgi:hypothetical protein
MTPHRLGCLTAAWLLSAALWPAAADAKRKPAKGPEAAIEQLASKGDMKAQLSLAGMYLRGEGVSADPYKAYLWAQAAMLTARFNDTDAGRDVFERAGTIRETVATRLTPDQMVQAHAEAATIVEDTLHGDAW